jgi:nucleoside-diphosphate-sugar epimerase
LELGQGALEDLVIPRMRILITGNMGYVGPAVVRHLRNILPSAFLVGFDSGFFAHCLTTKRAVPERLLDQQRFGDVRKIQMADLEGFDAVVHLAAISNDPMGNRFETVTDAINHRASVAIAEAAAKAGVKNFVFASSCSVYGFAGDGRARAEDDALNPLTAYARSKIATEESLRQFDFDGMTATSLRFATACGMSDRLRLDLVLNDFVACALTSGEITVLSDGTPWRPLINIRDMARAIEWAILRPAENGGKFLAVNAGSDDWNYQVRELAEAVAKSVTGIKVSINTAAPPDGRSYKVDFGLFRKLAPAHQPKETLSSSIDALCEGLREIAFSDRDFRQSPFIRLRVLEGHIESNRLGADLSWRG